MDKESVETVRWRMQDGIIMVATARGDIKERLQTAFWDNFGYLRPHMFPEAFQSKFQELLNLVDAHVPSAVEGTLGGRTKHLSDEQAKSVVRELVELYEEVISFYASNFPE